MTTATIPTTGNINTKRNRSLLNLRLDSIKPDGYPNLTKEAIDKLCNKDEAFFMDNIARSIYVASKAYNGFIEIIDSDHARDLYSAGSKEGLKFLSLVERALITTGTDSYDDQPGEWTPSHDFIYKRTAYMNGHQITQDEVAYIGDTPDKQHHIFQSITEAHKLFTLKAEGYSTYMKHAGNNILFETYVSIQ